MIELLEYSKAMGTELREKLIIQRECKGNQSICINTIYISCRVFSVIYTMDNRFVISGSDDTNIRIWKAKAS